MLKPDSLLRSSMLSLAAIAGLTALLLSGVVHADSTAGTEIKASRPAMEGCVWKPYQSQRLGIRLLFQECADPGQRYVLTENGDWLERHRPADDVIFGSHRIIRVFSKPASQSIEDTIRKNFIGRITLDDKREQAQARKHCRVVETPDYRLKDEQKITLTLVPTGRYKKKIDKDLQDSPRDFGCGEYGMDQAGTYFEYHPTRTKTKYAFVIYGMDEPLFDENSIEFIEKQ